MTVSKEDKIILVIIGVIIILIVGGILWGGYKDKRLVEETTKRVAAETRIIQDAKEFEQRRLEIDTLKAGKVKLEAVIEYQKNNPSIIIRENDKIHVDIDHLDAFNNIKLFTDNEREYIVNKERYGLHRFFRHD